MKLMQGSLAILAVAGLVAAMAIAPAAAESPGTAQTAKKKKCGKKGKKGAVAAKKCKKKKGGTTGPQMRIGDYACLSAGIVIGFQVHPGNKYTVNHADPGTYVLTPSTGHVDFKGGSFDWAYGIYSETEKSAPTVDVYSAEAFDGIQPGDYYGECGWLGPNPG